MGLNAETSGHGVMSLEIDWCGHPANKGSGEVWEKYKQQEVLKFLDQKELTKSPRGC